MRPCLHTESSLYCSAVPTLHRPPSSSAPVLQYCPDLPQASSPAHPVPQYRSELAQASSPAHPVRQYCSELAQASSPVHPVPQHRPDLALPDSPDQALPETRFRPDTAQNRKQIGFEGRGQGACGRRGARGSRRTRLWTWWWMWCWAWEGARAARGPPAPPACLWMMALRASTPSWTSCTTARTQVGGPSLLLCGLKSRLGLQVECNDRKTMKSHLLGVGMDSGGLG